MTAESEFPPVPVGKWWPCLVAARQAWLVQSLSERARVSGDAQGHRWLDSVARVRLRVAVSRLEGLVSS